MLSEPSHENWFVHTNNISQLWVNQPSYVISQAVYIFAGIITLIHAFSKGGRWPSFWLGCVLHGLFTDNFWAIVLPQYDNFWHSQTAIIFFGARLPLHIILLYPAFIYHAAYAVHRLNLPQYAEPFAVGLLTVLIDIPYDIVAVKFVHWMWHDTDPNIFDRHYWVPWNSYYFHAAFTASFYFFFHSVNRTRLSIKDSKWASAGLFADLFSMIISSVLGMPGGVLMFIFIYHPLHDIFKIHSEVTFFIFASIFFFFVLHGLLNIQKKPCRDRLTKFDYVLLFQLALHYVLYWGFVVFLNPENEVSVGYHQPIGPCDQVSHFTTPFGQTLHKKTYLCPNNFDEKYFDFHCVDKLPENGSLWYTICGTPFENRAEYITILTAISVFAGVVFREIYFKTKVAPVVRKSIVKKCS